MCKYINRQKVEEEGRRKFKELLDKAPHCDKYKVKQGACALIKGKSQKSVDVGICNSYGELGSFRMEAEDSVSSDVYVGQIIPLEV